MPRSFRYLFAIVLSTSLRSLASPVSQVVLVRDHVAGATRVDTIVGELDDSTAGSWVGTRPGVEGLPTPAFVSDTTPYANRRILQRTDAPPGWPGRIAVRLDQIGAQGEMQQQCSGTLVGPNFVLTGAHCLRLENEVDTNIQAGWFGDPFYARPGFDKGRDLPISVNDDHPLPPVRVVKSWIPRASVRGIAPDSICEHGCDWAVLELERDVGTELGWACVAPVHTSLLGKSFHILSYPAAPLLFTIDSMSDTATRSDSLSHWWAPIGDASFPSGAWATPASAWQGESGSGMLDCADTNCRSGDAAVRGTRWMVGMFSPIDSAISGIIAAILKSVQVPSSIAKRIAPTGFDLRASGAMLVASAPQEGQWQILSLDGRQLVPQAFGRTISVHIEALGGQVALIVFREPGKAPVVRRWVSR